MPYTYDPKTGNPMLDTEMEDKHNFKIGGVNEWYPGGPRSYVQTSDNLDDHLDEMGVPLPITYNPDKGRPLYGEVMKDDHDMKADASARAQTLAEGIDKKDLVPNSHHN